MEELRKTILIDVEAKTAGLKQNVIELNTSLDDLLDKRKLLTVTGQKSTKEFQDNEAALRLTKEQIRATNREIDNAIKAINAQNNSIAQNRALINTLTAEHIKLSQAEGATSTEAKKLEATIKQVTNEVKKQEKALGNHTREVGNYGLAFDHVSGVLSNFGGPLGEVAQGLNTVRNGFMTAKAVSTSMDLALKATGWGLLISLLGSVVLYFTKTERGAELLERALGGLEGAVNVLINPIVNFGESLVKAFNNPKEAAKSLLAFIENNLLNRFKAFGVIAEAIFNRDWKKAADGFLQLGTGIENVTGKAAGLGKALSEGFKSGTNVAKLKQDAEDIARDLNRQASKLRADANVLLAKGDAQSLKQAQEYFKKADQLTQQAVNSEISAQNALIKQKEKLGTARDEDYQKLNDLYAKIDQSRTKDASKAEKINTRLEKLAEQEKVRLEKATEEYKKKTEAVNKFFDSIQSDAHTQLDNVKRLRDAEVSERENLAKQIDAINQKNLDKFQKNEQKMNDLITERLQAQTNLANAQMLLAGTDSEKLLANQVFLDAKYQQDIDNAIRTGKDTTEITAAYTRDQEALGKEKDRVLTDSFDKFSTDFQRAVGKNSKVAKIAADVQARIDAAASIRNNVLIIQENMKALAAQGKIPFPLNLIAIFSTLAALASAASSAKTLFSVPHFADGGQFQSDGKGAMLPGYSKTDNTNAMLRSGETVIVSEAGKDPIARGILSAINVAYGGRAFADTLSMPTGQRNFAIGGIFTDGGNANRYYNQPVDNQRVLLNTMAYEIMNNFPPIIVGVRDINNQQAILAQTENRVTF